MPWLKLLRPKQWTKNLLVFAGLLFAKSYGDHDKVITALITFAAMCLVSSATYIFNDLRDLSRDRNHPVKKNRPLASGQVGVAAAATLGALLLVVGGVIGYLLGYKVLYIIVAYIILQIAYNSGLKRVPVADVFVLSLGFVLRAALGAAAINVKISGWLLFCTGALALLLGFGKRRHEYQLQGEARGDSRESLAGYTKPALDALVVMTACAAALCYGVYSIESETAHQHPGLIGSALFVFYGLCRYVFLIFSVDEGGEPENLLFGDPQLILSLVCFLISAVVALSGTSLPLLDVGGSTP